MGHLKGNLQQLLYICKVLFSQHWLKTIESPEAGAGFPRNVHLSN